MARIPKDVDKYIKAKSAGIRLLAVAVNNILMLKDGVLVKWELKLRYYRPAGHAPDAVVVVNGATFTSGAE